LECACADNIRIAPCELHPRDKCDTRHDNGDQCEPDFAHVFRRRRWCGRRYLSDIRVWHRYLNYLFNRIKRRLNCPRQVENPDTYIVPDPAFAVKDPEWGKGV